MVEERGPESAAGRPSRRLDSWKEIASYLGKSVRTVRRWEEKEGLPVRRHQHDRGSTVFAESADLDAWLAARSTIEVSPLPGADAGRSKSKSGETKANRTGRVLFAIAATLLLLAAGAAFWYLRVRGPEPVVAATAGAEREHWVLLTPFDNRTENELFDGLVEYAIEREVGNLEAIHVLPRERVEHSLALMRSPIDEPLDLPTARQVALRDAGISGIVTGRIETLGADYLLSVDLLDPADGSTLINLSQQFREGQDLLPAVSDLSRDVRKALVAEVARSTEPRESLAQVTTGSLDALRLYSQAQELAAQESAEAAELLLRQAIAADPAFASAYAQLAWAMRADQRAQDEYMIPAQQAVDLASGVSSAERFYIAASYEHLSGRLDRASASYEALLSLEPDHYWGNRHAYDICLETRNPAECFPYRVRTANLRADDFRSNYDAAWALSVLASNPSRARKYVERARQLITARQRLQMPEAVAFLEAFPLYEAWINGKVERALETEQELAAKVSDWPEELRSAVAETAGSFSLATGRTADAERWFRQISDERRQHDMQAVVLFARGEMEELARHLSRRSDYDRPMTAILLHAAGLEKEAEALLERFEETSERVPSVEIVRGTLALGDGELERALAALRRGSRALDEPGTPIYFVALDLEAMAHSAAGDPDRAATALAMTTDLKSRAVFEGAGLYWTKCQYRLAELYRELGREDEARQIESELRSYLSLAERDYPLLVALGGERASAG